MSFIDKVFKKNRTVAKTQIQLVNEPTTNFSAYSGNAYENDVFREGVDAIARNAAKLKGSHMIKYSDHETRDGDCKLNRLLQVRPNRYMSAYDFLYKLITRLYLYNNSFAYLDRDDSGNVRAIYPITATQVNIMSDPTGALFCGFMLKATGREVILPYRDVIHLRRFYSENEILGEDNRALDSGLELAQTENEGITAAIKAGANIRGILSFNQILSPSKLKEEKDAFIKDYLQLNNEGGVIATDQKTEYKPIENKPVILDADQAKQIKTKIYDYLGVNEAIVNSSYTDEQYNSFSVSTIEPIAIALSQEFTAKIFNDREQAYGNSIVFESGRLQSASVKTKINLISTLAPYGLITINQALEILNLPSVPDGDKRLQALNMIDQKIASEYQIGKKSAEDKEGSDDENEEKN